jgi:hypothetical protein
MGLARETCTDFTRRGHWELFPGSRTVPDIVFQEITGIFAHAGYGTWVCIITDFSSLSHSQTRSRRKQAYRHSVPTNVSNTYRF